MEFLQGFKVIGTQVILKNLNIEVGKFIENFRKAGILGEVPGEFKHQTVEQALKSGNITIRKLLTNKRFEK